MDRDRLHHLLQQHLDDVLTPLERAELSVMLLESWAAREAFWEAARWNALLRQWGEEHAGDGMIQAPKIRATGQRRWFVALAAVSVFVALLGLSRFVLFSHSPRPSAPSVAMLTHAFDTVWNHSGGRSVGESLAPGWLRQKAGMTQIEFARGARVVLEGPAELQVVSDNSVVLQNGRMRAIVPEPAHGFTVKTPQVTVTDLGTQFGLDITEKAAEIHVLEGRVEFRVAGETQPQALRVGEAMRVENGKATSIALRREDFVSDAALAVRERELASDRIVAWKDAHEWLCKHPASLLVLDFSDEPSSSRTLADRRLHAPLDAAAVVVGCEPTRGRWDGKTALEFKRVTDRVRATVPGTFPSLTLLAWVRVDSLPSSQGALLMTESFQRGEVHWYLYSDGRIGFGVRSKESGSGAWSTFYSATPLPPEMLGSWISVAVTFDHSTQTVRHYLNGRENGSRRLRMDGPLRLDTFEIGNCGVRADDPRLAADAEAARRIRPRNFTGRMDEFAALGVALTPEDIGRLHRAGKAAD